jgi:4-amino-4-deoxy-L-arabinose transferase-like glycosyltransferase
MAGTAGRQDAVEQPGTRSLALVLVVVLLAQAIWIAATLGRPLQLADEPREAAIALEMARSGDWLVPRLNGEPFVEKPPLMYILAALVVRATESTSPAWLRLPNVLAAVATLALVFLIARRLGAPAAAAGAALLATTNLFLSDALLLRVDPCLMAFVAAAAFATLEWWLAEGALSRAVWALLSALGLSLAVLTKGPVAILFHVSVVALLPLLDPRRSLWRLVGIGFLWLTALIPLGLWALALRKAGGDELLREAFLRNSWGRFSRADLGHDNPPWYYLVSLPRELAPWILFTLAGCVAAWKLVRRSVTGDRATVLRMAWSWALVSLVLLSLSAAKRALYLLPAVAAWSVLGGWWLAGLMRREPLARWSRWLVGLTTWGIGLGCVGFGASMVIAPHRVGPGMSAWALALVVPAGLCAWLLWRHRILDQPGRHLLGLLVAAQLALAAVAVPMASADRPEDSIEEARSLLQREAATAGRVMTFQLGERGRSVVSLAFAKVVDPLDDPKHLSFDDATSSLLLIADNQTSGAALDRLADHARVADVQRAPMGRQSLVVYRLAPKSE